MVPFDIAFQRSVAQFVLSGEWDINMEGISDFRTLLGRRMRDIALLYQVGCNGIPSLEDLFTTTANFIKNKVKVKRVFDEDMTARLEDVLQALKKPSAFQRILSTGDDFVQVTTGLFDCMLRFESFAALFDEECELTSIYTPRRGTTGPKYIAMLDKLILTVPQDIDRNWPGRNSGDIVRYLTYLRDSRVGNANTEETQYWQTEQQESFERLEASRHAARTTRAGQEEVIPGLQDAINENQDYAEYMFSVVSIPRFCL